MCLITRGGAFALGLAWTVALDDVGFITDGFVLSDQVRTVDWPARRAHFIEKAPAELVGEVLARVATLIE